MENKNNIRIERRIENGREIVGLDLYLNDESIWIIYVDKSLFIDFFGSDDQRIEKQYHDFTNYERFIIESLYNELKDHELNTEQRNINLFYAIKYNLLAFNKENENPNLLL